MTTIFGHVPGIPVGTTFPDRKALAISGIHEEIQAGIWKRKGEAGARSIVASGGYEDDEDYGDLIIYTGHGGRDPVTRKQVADQKLELGNLALFNSRQSGSPVRVTRGENPQSPFAPISGYRYDGLFRVTDSWHKTGKSGFRVYLFRLERITEDSGESYSLASVTTGAPETRKSWVQRIVRDSAISARIKELHKYRCQVCGLALDTASGPYAEAAHIRPLGRPHLGPDVEENCLCLCPNHHVQFDAGAFTVDPESLTIIGLPGSSSLRTAPGHSLSRAHLAYHQSHYFEQAIPIRE
jgi:putative restriction endonuclease